MNEFLRECLDAAVIEHFGDGASVADPRPLSGGASTDLWALTVDAGGAAQRLVLRAPGTSVDDDAAAREREWSGQLAAHRHGVLAPEPLFRVPGTAGEAGGRGMVIRFAEGEGRAKRILGEERFAPARATLLGELAAQAARIHSIPPAGVGLATPQLPPIEHALVELEDELDRLGEPHPALELGLRWLWINAPAERPRCVVHGDFRMGNVLVTPEGLSAVLDWELVHLGNPVQDLGWLCIRTWRFGHDDRPAAGLGTRDRLLAAYAEAGGAAVERDELRFWEVYGNVRWGVICVLQAARGRELGSLERAIIGRRACEAEWDLLAMIGEA